MQHRHGDQMEQVEGRRGRVVDLREFSKITGVPLETVVTLIETKRFGEGLIGEDLPHIDMDVFEGVNRTRRRTRNKRKR